MKKVVVSMRSYNVELHLIQIKPVSAELRVPGAVSIDKQVDIILMTRRRLSGEETERDVPYSMSVAEAESLAFAILEATGKLRRDLKETACLNGESVVD